MKLKFYSLLIIGTLVFSNCSYRLVDFTVISSKNVSLDINKANGKKVEATKTYFLGIGWNLKDAMDLALEKAGPNYDLLVDGVVRYGNYPFILTVTVEGTAVDSRAMKNEMGAVEFEKWLQGKEVLNADSSEKK